VPNAAAAEQRRPRWTARRDRATQAGRRLVGPSNDALACGSVTGRLSHVAYSVYYTQSAVLLQLSLPTNSACAVPPARLRMHVLSRVPVSRFAGSQVARTKYQQESGQLQWGLPPADAGGDPTITLAEESRRWSVGRVCQPSPHFDYLALPTSSEIHLQGNSVAGSPAIERYGKVRWRGRASSLSRGHVALGASCDPRLPSQLTCYHH